MSQCPHCEATEDQATSRRIGRALGVNHQSVINRVNSYHASLPPARPPAAAPETPEVGELFTSGGSKKRGRTSSPPLIGPRAASHGG
jgi:hypothetical protein